MTRLTLCLTSLVLFATGIWFGTEAHSSLFVSNKALWVYFIALLVSTVSLLGTIRGFVPWILLPLAGWAGWSYVHLYQAEYEDTFNDFQVFSGPVTIIALPDERIDYHTYLTVQPTSTRDLHHLLLIKTDRYPRYSYGDVIFVHGKLNHPAVIPGFNYPLYLQMHQVTATMVSPQLQFIRKSSPSKVRTILYRFRLTIQHINEHYLPEPEASFLNGILIGSTHAISPEITQQLSATSTTHLVVVGGAKLSIYLSLMLSFIPLQRRGSTFVATCVIAVIVTLLSGSSAGVERGALVAVLRALLHWQERLPNSLCLVILPPVLLLIINPLMLRTDAGFQISCLAYAGLVFFTRPLISFFQKIPVIRTLPSYFLHAIAENSAITLAIGPISYALFHESGIAGIIVNPLVFWLLGTLMCGGILLYCISWWPVVATILSLPIWILLHEILQVISLGALLGEHV